MNNVQYWPYVSGIHWWLVDSLKKGQYHRKHVLLTRPAMNITLNKIDIWQVRYHYSRDRTRIVSLLWRHQQSIVTSSAERRPSEWDTGTMCEDRRFLSSFMYSLCHVRNKLMYVLSWWTVSVLTRVIFLCLFPSLLRNSGNKHKNNPLGSTETVRHSSTYIIPYISWGLLL